MATQPVRIAGDWFDGRIPENVVMGSGAYVDTSYGFAAFRSERQPGLVLGERCGLYNRSTLIVGPAGLVTVGLYTILNETYLVCNERVTIGAHCLLSWGVVVTDSWHAPGASAAERAACTANAAAGPDRWVAPLRSPSPVVIEDSVWIGFGAVILPGVRLGQGCVVGCRTIVTENVAPYTVVVGSPARVVRVLDGAPTPNEQQQN
jgi:acetyltransferase-like isoleucine patch superfamily enzyme